MTESQAMFESTNSKMETETDSLFVIIDSNNDKYRCDPKFLKKLITFKNMIEDLGDNLGDNEDSEIPLPNGIYNVEHIKTLHQIDQKFSEIEKKVGKGDNERLITLNFTVHDEDLDEEFKNYNFWDFNREIEEFRDNYLYDKETKTLEFEFIDKLITLSDMLEYHFGYHFCLYVLGLHIHNMEPEEMTKYMKIPEDF